MGKYTLVSGLLSVTGLGEDAGYALIAVLAHELAHGLQLKNQDTEEEIYKQSILEGLDKDESEVMLIIAGKFLELHADFLAGYYIGRRSLLLGEGRDVASEVFRELGDFYFWSPTHHGTPSERRQVMLAGYRVGCQELSLEKAYEVGADYIAKNFFNPRAYPKCYGERYIRVYAKCTLNVRAVVGIGFDLVGLARGQGYCTTETGMVTFTARPVAPAKGTGGSCVLPAEEKAYASTLVSIPPVRALGRCLADERAFFSLSVSERGSAA